MKIKTFFTLIVPLFVLLVVNTYIVFQLISYKSTINELSENNSSIDRTLVQIIDDASEIRTTLNLPHLLYESYESFSEEMNYNEHAFNESTTTDDMLVSQAELINQKFFNDKISQKISTNIKNLELHKVANQYQLQLKQKNTTISIKYQDFIVGTIKVLYEIENANITSLQFNSNIIPSYTLNDFTTLPQLFIAISRKLDNNLSRAAQLKKEIDTLFKSKKITLLLLAHNSKYRLTTTPSSYVWKLYNIADQQVMQLSLVPHNLSLSSNYSVISAVQKSNNEILDQIENEILTSNYLTDEENLTQTNLARLVDYTRHKKFVKQLALLHLSISEIARSDDDYYYLDIINAKPLPHKIGSFAIQKSNGNFWSMDKNDIPLEQKNLFSIAPPEVIAQQKKYNILLVGSHNKLADTIILVHINSDNSIKLISIPRDLYYKGRKVNWYYKRFSPSNFNTIISDITGLPISQYVYVDMYAFVSVIDILGGINVFLSENLIDPDYRIKDNGIITYLQYEKGEHHVAGIEALRIARSRYSTNDFDRASRQQAILTGIKDRLNSVDKISSFISIIKIIDQIRPYVNTNISTIEIAQMIQKYRNSSITNKLVLNTDNILYSSYSNVFENNVTKEEIPSDELGQWILLPQNNDWEALKFYIERFILK